MNTQISSANNPPDNLNDLVQAIASLGQSWQKQKFEGEAAELLHKVQPQVTQIYRRLKTWLKGGSPPSNWYLQLLRLLNDRALDPVLVDFIFCRLGPSASNGEEMEVFALLVDCKSEERSASAYLANRHAYDQVFADFLPTALKKEARKQAHFDYMYDEAHTAKDDYLVFLERHQRFCERPSRLIGCSTGLSQLDEALNGLHGLTIFAGDKGIGKTTLAIDMTAAALQTDPQLIAVFCSLDMPKDQIISRFLCRRAQVTYRELMDRTSEKQESIREAGDALAREIFPRLRIRQRPQGRFHDDFVEAVDSDLNALSEQTSAERSLIIIDSFRRIPVPSDRNPITDPDLIRLDILGRIVAPTRALLVISEIRKTDTAFREPTLDDVRGTSSIGYTADNVLLMWPVANQKDQNISRLNLRIAKGRDGVVRRDIPLLFDHAHYGFCEVQSAAKPARNGEKGKAADPLAGHRGKRKSK